MFLRAIQLKIFVLYFLRYLKDIAPQYPMELYLDMTIYEITNIDEKAYTISASLSITIRWSDNRTEPSMAKLEAWSKPDRNFGKISLTSATSNKLWSPNLKIHGLRNSIPDVRSITTKDSNNIIFDINTWQFQQKLEMLVTLSCAMDFKNYPYDYNECPLLIYEEVTNGKGAKILFDNIDYMPYHSQDENLNPGIPFLVKVEKFPLRYMKNMSVYYSGANIMFHRHCDQVFYSYFFPTMAYVFISWISFSINKEVVSPT